jgi:RNA polymerase sigma factor (sigma-70 family)
MKQKFFNRLVLEFSDSLYRYVRRLISDDDTAQDIVQETFLKIWQQRKELKQINNLQAYCFTIARNKSLDWLKSAPVKQRLYVEYENKKLNFSYSEEKEELKIVRKLIDELPENQRSIIHLREIEGREFSEIAEILDLDVGNVRVILSRTRKHLKEKVAQIYAYGT